MANLNLKSFNQLVTDQVAAIQAQSNVLIDFSIGAILRAFTESTSGIALWLESLALSVLAVTRAATSNGDDLASFVQDFGMTTLPGAPSSGVETFSRFSPVIQVLIPVGTPIQTSDGSQQFVVVVDPSYPSYSASQAGYIVPSNTASLDVPIQSLNQEAAANVTAGSITVMTQAIIGIDFISNAAPTAGGQDPEKDPAIRIRFVAYIASLARGTRAAIAYSIMSVQSGLLFSNVENTNYVTGMPQPGFFFVVLDDGSGNPPSSLLTAVFNAIDLYRAEGVEFAVYPPTLVYAAIAMTITTGPTYDHGTIALIVQSAITAYVDTLLDGAALAYTRLIQVAFDASPGVINVSNTTINGSPADLSVVASAVIRASTVTVT
jgi:hypothetical protein